MGAAVGVNEVPIVGQPVAYGTGFLVLVVVGLSAVVARHFYTLAGLGGRALVAGFLFKKVGGFHITESGGDTETGSNNSNLVGLTRYAAPSLFGLGGAALLASGNAFAALFIAGFFSALALFLAGNGLALLVAALVVTGVFALGLYGDAVQQATGAVTLVWFLLISGLVYAFVIPLNAGDAYWLSQRLLLPPSFWKLLWVAIAVVSLYVGGRLLLVPRA